MKELEWKTLEKNGVLHTRVFDVNAKKCESADGTKGKFYTIDASDWVVVVPVIGDDFVVVKQWRHGSGCVTCEFPGGIIEKGEEPLDAARRETEEETAYRAGKLTKLGEMNPNPALYTNRLHIYLAEDLTPVGEQHLDDDEFINYFVKPIDEVIRDFASGEYQHAYTGTALALYMRERLLKNDRKGEKA